MTFKIELIMLPLLCFIATIIYLKIDYNTPDEKFKLDNSYFNTNSTFDSQGCIAIGYDELKLSIIEKLFKQQCGQILNINEAFYEKRYAQLKMRTTILAPRLIVKFQTKSLGNYNLVIFDKKDLDFLQDFCSDRSNVYPWTLHYIFISSRKIDKSKLCTERFVDCTDRFFEKINLEDVEHNDTLIYINSDLTSRSGIQNMLSQLSLQYVEVNVLLLKPYDKLKEDFPFTKYFFHVPRILDDLLSLVGYHKTIIIIDSEETLISNFIVSYCKYDPTSICYHDDENHVVKSLSFLAFSNFHFFRWYSNILTFDDIQIGPYQLFDGWYRFFTTEKLKIFLKIRLGKVMYVFVETCNEYVWLRGIGLRANDYEPKCSAKGSFLKVNLNKGIIYIELPKTRILFFWQECHNSFSIRLRSEESFHGLLHDIITIKDYKQTYASYLIEHLQLLSSGKMKYHLSMEGPFFGHSSFSVVNLNTFMCLKDNLEYFIDIKTNNIPSANQETGLSIAQLFALKSIEGNNSLPSKKLKRIVYRHEWPPNLNRNEQALYLHEQPWEFDALPYKWIKSFINDKRLHIIVPSDYNKGSFLRAGLGPNQVSSISLGTSPLKFRIPILSDSNLNQMHENKFVFFFNGGLLARKGIDILLQAYIETFNSTSKTKLIIHSSYGDSFHRREIQKAKSNPNFPELVFIEKDLTFYELLELYKSSNVYISPYRSEGFGLTILEAIQSGKPVIISNYSAPIEFAWRSKSTILVGGFEEDCLCSPCGYKSVFGLRTEKCPKWFKPDINDISKIMKELYVKFENNSTEYFNVTNARLSVEHLTWANRAKKLHEIIKNKLE
ncbi:UDP-Glycosyltransferase/glycogen phosphorylase [Rozella allomycis CSF55]|uniref:UDP-Glycosyltransferase/glycogen phosphorylase n=1 Tax=Rozella allomycis (strain CSF55) TaxID=988480 RepID=A0A075B5E7_ROZAC|nr:hypothetical protein O9G_005830 [Rozella allomycis CSF55]RKP21657.1 UDP-Glycosyltransferase/glycogen phosphorylase [Rozella allomycis CSF55]|eukprot:EPZ37061.1 hypothetical protein O9G_005830 [Rozella allomycis CSF55]